MNVVNMDSGLYPPDANSPQPGDDVHTDDYAIEERLAIQSEDDLPLDRGFDDVPGFEGMPDLTPAQHGAILHRIMYPAPDMGPYGAGVATEHPDGSMTIRYLPAMEITRPPVQPPAPATVTCGACAEFEPGKTPLGIGTCSRTANGLPPVASRGYGACFPIAPRSCPDHKELT
ncbi:hypothetical protein [Acidithiobacillus sulfurivorans]|uniref:Uncharacterized protein n=1 Tax=Acidithiobacillus sulfurivorans TaxID=1958756 RepID=A0ABS6A1J9_9PROT|nr:hypothetical protein [Acidithiobacillus sulfurivorans]MBU2761247.1 hypothetical protein [Acidithiobacillus sulfurivorans]